MRGFKTLLAVVLSICLIIVLLISTLDAWVSNMDFYRSEYERYGRPEYIGMSEDALMRVTKRLVDYMRSYAPDVVIVENVAGEEREVFGEREREHMVDVRNLYTAVLWARNATAALALVAFMTLTLMYKRGILKTLAKSFLAVSGAFVGTVALIGLFAALDFTAFWNVFHRIFFTNDLWMLYPHEIMIQMFPEAFFSDMVLNIFTTFAVLLIVLCLLCAVYLAVQRRKARRVGANV